jgi:hypothetical protein
MHAGLTSSVGRSRKRGLCRKIAVGPPAVGPQLLVEPLILCVFPHQARAEKLRIDTNQAPAAGIQGAAIGGKRVVPSCEPICTDDLVRVLAGLLVAHIVVARQGHDPRAQVTQRGSCERNLAVTVRSVDREVAITITVSTLAASANSRSTHQFSQKKPCVGERWMSDRTTMRVMLAR